MDLFGDYDFNFDELLIGWKFLWIFYGVVRIVIMFYVEFELIFFICIVLGMKYVKGLKEVLFIEFVRNLICMIKLI